ARIDVIDVPDQPVARPDGRPVDVRSLPDPRAVTDPRSVGPVAKAGSNRKWSYAGSVADPPGESRRIGSDAATRAVRPGRHARPVRAIAAPGPVADPG